MRALLTVLFLLIATRSRAEEMVRIAVAKGLKTASISGKDLSVRELREGAEAHRGSDRTQVTLDGDKLLVNGKLLDGSGAVFSASGPIHFGDLALAGELEIRRSEQGFSAINALPIEEYVASVLGGEMPASFPGEAQKAQAVAARTYALSKKLGAVDDASDFHLGSTVLHQVYQGAARIDPASRKAAQATRGEVLVFEHALAEAYFHSTCGGQTERGLDALGRDLAYLKPVRCGHCGKSPRAQWSLALGGAELGRLLKLQSAVTSIQVIEKSASGRAAKVEVMAGGSRRRFTAVELRQLIGYDRLHSLDFAVKAGEGGFTFDGHGSGHGAGLCQWGANGMAREGASYREILARYYPGAEIVPMY